MINDLISRQAAIDALYHIDEYNGRSVEAIRNLSSARSERKPGKWIPHKSIFGGLGERVYTCNKCGYNIGFHVENFCPNCGTKMEGALDE